MSIVGKYAKEVEQKQRLKPEQYVEYLEGPQRN